jgi:hypothetical protein
MNVNNSYKNEILGFEGICMDTSYWRDLYGYKLLKGFVWIQVIEGICMDGIFEWNCPLENSIYKSLHVEMAEVRLFKASMHAYTLYVYIHT